MYFSNGNSSGLSGDVAAAVTTAVNNGIATYAPGDIERLAGVPQMAALLARAQAVALPRAFTLAQRGAVIEWTAVASTFTSVTAADNGAGKVRLSSAGVHGLSAAAVGRSIYVDAVAGGIPDGTYTVLAVPSTTSIDIDVAYVATSIVAIGTVNGFWPAWSMTIPGGIMGANGCLEVETLLEYTASTNAKYINHACGGTFFSEGYASQTAYPHSHFCARLVNQNSLTAQRGQYCGYGATAGYSPAPQLTKDTTIDQPLSVLLKMAVPDEYIRISALQVRVLPAP